ncbi:DUF1640 domain-containing protein [Methylobacterium sp. NEAU 140]|uniref:coiled-coil domain-containing protein n=1 Tax=Methylobacterium sp. NEAU 140 TaxID=3064945 RepID=UPI0027365086|nr:coiled-coil domain-containing protein [Methylobacterium sp. NEAU 140]MDP4021945.1 DUF1640 domain-containing protein [Methylobacterium sp. NEAU 140]
MTAVAFDTLKFSRTLREKARLSPEQAEGLADALVEVLDGNLATKGDIAAVRGDIEALKIQTQADIEALKLSTKAGIEALGLSTKADLDALRLSTKADLDALRLSTKADLDVVKLSTKADIDALRLSTKADIETVRREIATSKAETIKWLIGAVGFQTIAVLGAVLALSRSLH